MKTLRTTSAFLSVLLFHTSFCSAPDSLHAKPAAPDSLGRDYMLDEIVVTATRREVTSSTAPSAVTVVRREAIEEMPGTLLSSALSWTPGLSLRSYGAGASVQTISLRGMSPEHTLLLVDGQRSNSFENGFADFGLISSSSVDRVEIVRGGSSALYGADAVGGVINVITRSAEPGVHGSASAMLGSSHTSGSEIVLETGEEHYGLRGSLRREQGREDYQFRFSDGRTESTLTRAGEDFSLLTGNFRADWSISPVIRTTASLSYTDADRGSPGVVTDPSSSGRGRLSDRSESLRWGIDWNATGELALRINGTAHYDVEHFDDPGQLLNGTTLHSLYANHDAIITPEVLFNFSPALSGLAGVEYARASLQSTETSNALRIQRSAFLSTEHAFGLPLQIPFEVIVYPSVRYDSYSDVAGDVSPRLGLNIGLFHEPSFRLRASYGRSFRVPVLNDLYWIEGGNPALRPERALSFDAGFRFEAAFMGSLRVDASYFSIDSRDRIVWIPASGTFWSPKNISSVASHGEEAEAVWTGLGGSLRLTVNGTWANVTKTSADFAGDPTEGKRLIYEPAETFNAVAEAKLGNVVVLLRHTWVSYRYTTEINDRFLPAYSLQSGAVKYTLRGAPFRGSIKAEITNMLNTSYQVVALYPMPLREFRMTVEAGL
jgi:outer membrane cobalamin receptor